MSDEYEAVGTAPDPDAPEHEQVGRKQQSKALTVDEDKGYIVPRDLTEAFRMAQGLVAAGWAPSSYNNDPAKVALGLASALEAGLPPLYGMRQIAIINGRPTMWGDALLALVQGKDLVASYEEEEVGDKPHVDELTKWPDNYGFRITIKRRRQEGAYVGVFTVGDAKRAKLWMNAKKAPWMEHPKRMLKNRARAFALRDGFADALGGIAVREEIEDTFGADKAEKPLIELRSDPLVEAPPMPGEVDAPTADQP